jgi:hypothetical protein
MRRASNSPTAFARRGSTSSDTSPRDPGRGLNLAILSCRAFARSEEAGRQTWRIHLGASGCRAFCEMPKIALDFDRGAFSSDPRIAAIQWER